jgi:hypothetical protein
MSTRVLRIIAIVLPTAFWFLVLLLRTELFSEQRTIQGDLFAIVVIGFGAVAFAIWIFRVVENREEMARSDQRAPFRR